MSEKIEKLEKLKENMERRKPSEEMSWLNHYKDGAFERANDIPYGLTLWDVLEEKLLEFVDVNALEYFKREFERPDFIEQAYLWARTFRAMGVEENEVVPIYGPFFPDICAMICGLNMIGATSYCLKLAITKEALEEETADSKVAVVYDGMWQNVKEVFKDDRFKKILVASPTDALDFEAKIGMLKNHPIETIKSLMAGRKAKSAIPMTPKYVWLDDAKAIASYFTGKVKAPFVPNRDAFITSSSGTTIGGVVKGTIATNEGAIAQLKQCYNAEILYHRGRKAFTNLPPTASTSLNCLFFLALYYGMTCIIEPRMSEVKTFDQIMENKPNVVLTTGSFWETFFRRVDSEIKKGKTPDLSFADMFIMGGEGADPEDKAWFDSLMLYCKSKYPLFSGSGMSEMFSVTSVEKADMKLDAPKIKRPVISVGIPFPGLEVKIVNPITGEELDYNERGELLLRGKNLMKSYYKKPELTAKSIDENGWLHTGDMYSMDEDGQLYIWGRLSDKITLSDGTDIYLFDIANQIKTDPDIRYCIVNPMPLDDGTTSLVAHVVFRNSNVDREEVYRRIDEMLSDYLPSELSIAGYKEHDVTFIASRSTAKKDRNGMQIELDGYGKPDDYGLLNLTFTVDKTTGNLAMHYSQVEKARVLAKRI